ncbi:DNL-type zinc finger protein-like [Daktulosphaira vitifoliae]|uniref:DNL-type zinc finger protein-like n=1 Tax=Daktulosphaira vitifoliae TaxID=58002 RepID=UPI0021AAF2C8|nr:DNL-type zinc finger protein-like [Daktulosphaira vitifoliae]
MIAAPKLFCFTNCIKVSRLSTLLKSFPTEYHLTSVSSKFKFINTRPCTTLPVTTSDKKQSEEVKSAKMQIFFKCTVCNTKNNRTFSKVSYEKGIVIIECDGCKNNHLIADNLGWFPDSAGNNIEDILAAKGEKVKRTNGCFELFEK